jgi:RNA polymerase-binding protein DksA
MIDPKILEELENALVKEKEELERDLGKIAKPVNAPAGDYETSFDDIGSGKEDNATEVDQYTQNLSVETTLEKKLQEVIAALGRMKDGTYGKCSNCGKDIPVERLKANPSATVCLDC